MTTHRDLMLAPLSPQSTRTNMDSRTEPNNESTTDIDNVQSMIKGLYIERKHDDQSTGATQPHHNHHHNNNPFKRKPLKKHKRKLSICYSSSQCKDILVKLDSAPNKSPKDNKESAVMLKITEKMAKAWNEDGYRKVILPSTAENTSQSSEQNKSTAASNNNSEDNSENHSQVSSQTCARQAMYDYCDSSVTELAAYLDEALFIPRKMSFMAEMMYT